MVDIRDDSYTGRSPCRDCPQHLQGVDKNDCVENCQRLAVYRTGESWERRNNIVKEDEYPISNIEQNSPLERGVREANGVCKTSNEQLKMCVVDGCNKEVFCRGLCENHYKRWQLGKIEHPTFGKFFKIHHFPGRKPKKKPAPGVPVKDKIQKSAVGTDRIEEILPTPADELSPVEPEHTVSYLPPKGITLDLDSYPKIKEAVYGSAEKHFLTPEHVIISLLGKALADRKEKTSYIK